MKILLQKLILLSSLLLLLSSCVSLRDEPFNDSIKTTRKPSPSAIPTLVIPPEFSCVPRNNKREMAHVIKVIDGDSILVEKDGEKIEVRYIGINAPEFNNPQKWEAESSRGKNADLVLGKTIWMISDVRDRDKYDRLLRFVFVDGLFVNLELVMQGAALVQNYPPDISCQAYFWQNMPE